MKINKTLILIGIVVFILFFITSQTKKDAGGLTRTIPSSVLISTDVTVTYSSSASTVSLEQVLPTGWTMISGMSCNPAGTTCRADGAPPITVHVRAPSSATTSTWAGVLYTEGADTSWSTSTSQTVSVIVCTPSNACADSTCVGSTCSDGCGGTVPGAKPIVNAVMSGWSGWGACSALCGGTGTETRTRSCTTQPQCGGTPCGTTSDSQSCSLTGNTVADTNCNGCVENQEYSTAKSSWLAFTMDNAIYSPIKSNWLGFTGC